MRSKPPLNVEEDPVADPAHTDGIRAGAEHLGEQIVEDGIQWSGARGTLIEITHTRTPRLVTSNRLTAVLFAMRQEEMYAIRGELGKGSGGESERRGYGGGDPVFFLATKRKTSK